MFSVLPAAATEGDDSIDGTPGNDSIDGLGGNDSINGMQGDDTLLGRDGDDWLTSYEGNSSLDGGNGHGKIWSYGPSTLIGGEGNDGIFGEGGYLDGSAGNDTMRSYADAATLLGGDGNDNIEVQSGVAGYLVDGGTGDDVIYSTNALIYGGSGNDDIHLTHTGIAPTVFGGDGNDFIEAFGQAVAQVSLDGGAGNDTLNPGLSAQGAITTGDGSDQVWLSAGGHLDILDFTAGTGGDHLEVSYFPAEDDPFASHTLAVEQQGNDVLVRWDAGAGSWETAAVLRNVDIDDLTAFNFDGYTPIGRVQASESNDTLTGSGIIDRILGLGGNDVIRGFAGNDTIDGGAGTDSLYGGAGNDTYYVDQAADKVFESAGEGNDIVYASVTWKASDNIEAVVLTGTGNIAAYGSAQANTLTGNSGNNTLNGANGNDTINGGDGNDKVDGGADHDVINGGAGKDSLTGGEGSDSIDGGTGNDQMNGGARWDTLRGGEGDDILDGGLDNDQMYGGTGNDTYAVDHVGDRVYENFGEGTDTVKASISYTLTSDVESLYLIEGAVSGTGNGLVNTLNGSSLDNALSGLGGNDSLYGWDGDDSLVGDNDHDRLSGGNGNDTLVGGHGNDNLGGGAGADDFVFSSTAINGHDHVVDFVHGLDRLVFKGSDYGLASGHGLTAAEFTVGSAAVGVSAQFVWDIAERHLWFDADGSGAGAAIELALISGSATVTKDDLYFT